MKRVGWFVVPALFVGVCMWGAPALADNGECSAGVKLADKCDTIGGIIYEGCCKDSKVVWCEADGTALCYIDCPSNADAPVCGWNEGFGGYDCATAATPDPAGKFPLACTWNCTPQCTGKACGSDGCLGTCGVCPTSKPECDATGQCQACAPKCGGKVCGDDGCGGTCGKCATGEVCDGGACCKPQCDGKTCGDDGCGGECGKCTDTQFCSDAGKCEACTCTGKDCGDDGCGTDCGTCKEGSYCSPAGKCLVCSCADKDCGGDGCGKPCGTCTGGQVCSDAGKCLDPPAHCVEKEEPGCPGCACEKCVCDMDDYCCGTAWDGQCIAECADYCGGASCGCTPDCGGAKCGDDGCGGTCGLCPSGTTCSATGQCAPCTCEGKECGDDGCGKDCGKCADGKFCHPKAAMCVDSYCLPSDKPGCPGCACEQCVCQQDDYCCATAWDSICADQCWKDCGAPKCNTCKPDCTNKKCGDDGCAGECGKCAAGELCQGGQCVTCTPSCTGKTCGDDGCGGSCGSCPTGKTCSEEGKCVGPYPESCLGASTPSADTCITGVVYEGCCDDKARVVYCQEGKLYCINCAEGQKACGWKEAGEDSYYDCGGAGEDPKGKFKLQCPAVQCTPTCDGKTCGNDGCGGDCGKCADGQVCEEYKCVTKVEADASTFPQTDAERPGVDTTTPRTGGDTVGTADVPKTTGGGSTGGGGGGGSSSSCSVQGSASSNAPALFAMLFGALALIAVRRRA